MEGRWVWFTGLVESWWREREADVKGGLTRRMVVASGLLALIVAAAFAFVFFAITNLRETTDLRRRTREAQVAADGLATLVINLETGLRGFVITGAERFLQPWNHARSLFPEEAATLERLVADDPGQLSRVRRIVQAATSYIEEYSLPLIDAVRRNDPSARSVARTQEGKRRVDALRSEFDAFEAAERTVLAPREANDAAAANRALVAAGVGVMGSILLVLLFSGYLTREIVWPVRRAALMAGRLAGGDLGTRMPENSAGEIGTLERSFNTMAKSLEESRDDLARLADEQAALRRVATLVAKGASPNDVFAAVAEEVGRALQVDLVNMVQYMPDETVTVMASWSGYGKALPGGTRSGIEGRNISALVFRTQRPARIDDYSEASGDIAAYVRELGVRSSVGSPIVVNRRLWGAMIASSRQPEPLTLGSESHISAFTDLVGTAISNAQARAELAASRARIVAASDESRRSIERDLHDGTQQRLVSLGLELRGAELGVPPEMTEVKEQMSRVGEGLEGALEDLREISRGIHPAILSEGGLGPAIKALARRSAVPIKLDVRAEARLPEPIEVAAYYVVSEALANAAKHAKASAVYIDLETRGDILHLSVRDDGIGGADLERGSGLIGLTDRVEALGGTIAIASPIGQGTTMVVELPLGRV
jgi:signal transduction histidine kinase